MRPAQVRGPVDAARDDKADSGEWSREKFTPPGKAVVGNQRRAARERLRQLLREVTEVERCQRCGKTILGGAVVVKVNAGVAHFANLETCGRIWLCAVCAAKIRARRGDEVAEGVGRHIGNGGGCYFLTCTLPHEHGDALKASLDVLTDSWRSLTADKMCKRLRRRLGVLGQIKSVEITHGVNGWHPHIHAVMITRAELMVSDLCEWYPVLDGAWSRALVRNGWPPGKRGIRVKLDLVQRSTTDVLARYLTKIQDGGAIGNEIARADLKAGRWASRTPLQILADFGTEGLATDLDLWHEYERATVGRSAIRWSRGLRQLLLPDVEEQTDEEIAAEDVGGETVAALLPGTWYRLAEIPGAPAAVLAAIEQDGFEGLIRILVRFRLDLAGALTPDEWEDLSVGV